MAGGTYENYVPKVRPGTYINFAGDASNNMKMSGRGTVLLPLLTINYGPECEFIRISSDAPDASMAKLGYSIYDRGSTDIIMICEALKRAREVIVYIPHGGTRASGTANGLTCTAKYTGIKGDGFIVDVSSISGTGYYNVKIKLSGKLVEQFTRIKSVSELAKSAFLDFSGSINQSCVITLSGGLKNTVQLSDMTKFLDKCESINFNTMACFMETYNDLIVEKIKYLREEAGKYRKAVLSNCKANYEGIINVTNGVKLADGTTMDSRRVTAWVAGADASALNTESNTYTEYEGAVEVVEPKDNAAAIEAIENGEFFFSMSESGRPVVEYDINSLTDKTGSKTLDYRKNRVLRVFDTFAQAVMLTFLPNKYSNGPLGWDVMEGVGRALLRAFESSGAIADVDYDYDFLVDRARSVEDCTYFKVALHAIDSAEKLYFDIITR